MTEKARPRPGDFHATCRLQRPVPYDDVPEDVRPLVDADVLTPGRIKSRWDRKLGNVVDLPCDFATTDRDEFTRHMTELHDGGRYRWENGRIDPAPGGNCPTVRTYRARMPIPVKPWKPPALRPEGKPVRTAADVRALTKEPVLACRGGCGFVVEDRGRDVTAIIEAHKASCAARQDVA